MEPDVLTQKQLFCLVGKDLDEISNRSMNIFFIIDMNPDLVVQLHYRIIFVSKLLKFRIDINYICILNMWFIQYWPVNGSWILSFLL